MFDRPQTRRRRSASLPTSALVALGGLALSAATAVAQPTGECGVLTLDARGNPILPADAWGARWFQSPAGGWSTGRVVTLYDRYNPTTADWYDRAQADPKRCPFSIGDPGAGSLPDPYADLDPPRPEELVAAHKAADLIAIDLARTVGTGIDALQAARLPLAVDRPYVEPTCAHGQACADLRPRASPFDGRDIIFVHGFMPNSIVDSMLGDREMQKTWPADRRSFTSIEPDRSPPPWNQVARTYWQKHVDRFLRGRGARNRILVVSWPSTQTMEVAVHATLSQIGDAMISGQGVQLLDATDPRGTTGFCLPDCVIVSHSTGAPVTDVAMALAAATGVPGPNLIRKLLGDLRFIPSHMKVHVALAGAFSGSELAGYAIAGGIAVGVGPVPTPVACIALWKLLGTEVETCLRTPIGTILRDLTPGFMQRIWHPLIAATPVPVLTVSGAVPVHDTGPPLRGFVLRGLDDATVNVDSSCARASLDPSWPTGVTLGIGDAPDPFYFDPGIAAARGGDYFADQTRAYTASLDPTPRATVACHRRKAPWGMVEPFAVPVSTATAPDVFLPNHHPFLQAASLHSDLRDGDQVDREDVSAVLGPLVFDAGLVDPAFRSLEEEEVRGSGVSFNRTIFGRTFTFQWWWWRRTYHVLRDWRTLHAADYVYRFVAP